MLDTITPEHIAHVAHEANRAYCLTIGDDSQGPWEDAPDWQKESAIEGVNFHLGLLKQGITPEAAASHENWLKHKIEDGWVWGEKKDPAAKTHPQMVPYSSLEPQQRAKDYIFAGIVQAMFRAG